MNRMTGRVALILLGLSFTSVANSSDIDGYLYADGQNRNNSDQKCPDDSLDIASSDYVRKAIDFLSLNDVLITFVGCPEAAFKTGGGFKDRVTKKKKFLIQYPTTVSGENLRSEEYIAPIVHEIGHVYQIKAAGSPGELKQGSCSERIELGADFLAGFVFANGLGVANKKDFQESLRLLGDYSDDPAWSHSIPEDRTAAFRSGYYMVQKRKIHQLDDAYTIFQDMDFARYTANSPFIKAHCK
ncbi:hypothetical protein [Rhizobium ruizarguesonis]|uniref:hypothetical protein n=1 Tax=Rhizobium ruizarguesonis TaxID=2081791 RepID=UPI00117B1393|nr:hypothetical protein [Rhizobium ruizarguesonis]UED34239.1 hypothetical protein BSO17_24335 [Rhizobium ruizarguesonis]